MYRAFILVAVFLLTTGCASAGYYVENLPGDFKEKGYVMLRDEIFLPEGKKSRDCGPESISAVFKYLGYPVKLNEISSAVYSPKLGGTLSTDIAPYIRKKGFTTLVTDGTLDLIKFAINKNTPPIIMIDVSDLPRAIMDILGTESTYHFFVVAGYNNAERILLCKYYGKGYYVIKYDELVRRWSRTGFFYVEVRPSAAVDYFNKGAELEYLGRYQEARENYMKAIEKDSEHFLSYVGLGNVSLAVGDFESALKAYQRALSLDRTEPKILNNLANLYVERGENLEEAEKLAEEAVQRYKKILDDLNTRIVSGQEEGSVKKLHQEKEFEYCLALGTLGEARLRLGKYTLAISSWEAAISIIPLTKFDLRAKRLYEIGLAYKNLKETQKAGHYFRQAIDLVKDSELKSKIQKEILDSPVK